MKAEDAFLIFQWSLQNCELKKVNLKGIGIWTKLFQIYQTELPTGHFYLPQKVDKMKNTDVLIWKSHMAKESPGILFNFKTLEKKPQYMTKSERYSQLFFKSFQK